MQRQPQPRQRTVRYVGFCVARKSHAAATNMYCCQSSALYVLPASGMLTAYCVPFIVVAATWYIDSAVRKYLHIKCTESAVVRCNRDAKLPRCAGLLRGSAAAVQAQACTTLC